MNDRNKEAALAFIAAVGAADPDAAAAVLADDVQTTSKGFSKIRGTRDREQMLGAIGMFKALMPEGLQPTTQSVTAEGDRVVVEFQGDAMMTNGAAYSNEYVMIFTLRDGKITNINEYFCTKLVDEVVWPLIAATTF